MEKIYFENEYIKAYPTETSLCVVENKKPYDLYLVFDVDRPLGENRILGNGTMNVTNEEYIEYIKDKDFQVLRFAMGW